MLSRIENAAACEIEHAARGCVLCRPLATMEGLCAGKINTAPAELACAYREVHVLEVDEEALVEPAKRLENTTTHEEERTHHLIDHTRVVMRPFGHEVRR